MLGLDHAFAYTQDDAGLRIELPAWLWQGNHLPGEYVQALRIEVDAHA